MKIVAALAGSYSAQLHVAEGLPAFLVLSRLQKLRTWRAALQPSQIRNGPAMLGHWLEQVLSIDGPSPLAGLAGEFLRRRIQAVFFARNFGAHD
jgi:hypothetical protein